MPKLTDYERSIRDTGKMNADRARKKWGIGWESLSRDMQENAIAMVCLSGVLSAIDKQVEVQIVRDIYVATLKAAGLLED